MVMMMIAAGMLPSSAASAGAPSAAATLGLLPDEHHLEPDLLKGELVTGPSEETERPLGGLKGGSELDADGLAEEMGKVVPHLPVEDEGDVGIELLLQLEELEFAMLPGTGLEHGEHEDILAGIVGKGVEHPGTLDSGSRRRAVCAGQIFADGNHT